MKINKVKLLIEKIVYFNSNSHNNKNYNGKEDGIELA